MDTNSENIDLHQYKPERSNKTFSVDEEIGSDDQFNDSAGSWETEEKRVYSYKPQIETTVFDVAAYILEKCGEMTTMKLQKLAFYSQAWSLVWDEKPLFKEKIEAWANGPVIRELFAFHRGYYTLLNVTVGNSSVLSSEQKQTVDAILDYYANKSSQWLIELAHLEEPWKKARTGLLPTERGDSEITNESLAEYYSSL